MIIIAHYDSFNSRRYSNPWVAIVGSDHAPDFSKNVGGYTGGYMRGEAGDLYIDSPREGEIYIFGQKDYRGRGAANRYITIVDGAPVPCDRLGRPIEQEGETK